MIWTLTVSNDTRTSSDKIIVYISSSGTPPMNLIGPTDVVQPNQIINVRVNLTNYPLSNYSFYWVVTGCPDLCCYQGNTALDFINIKVWNITLPTFSVTAYVTDKSNGRSTICSLDIEVDVVPTLGSLIVTPSSGFAWYTNFTLQATMFSLPRGSIYYQFGILTQDTNQFIPLSLNRISSSLTTQLPAFNSSQSNTYVQVVVRASNKNGGYVQANSFIRIIQSPIISSISVLEKYNQLKQSADLFDSGAVLAQVIIGSLLLSPKNDSSISLNTTFAPGFSPCHGNGFWSNGKGCQCNAGYKSRQDCSLSDAQFLNESTLAATIVSDCINLTSQEPSKSKYPAIYNAMQTIITKPDLLNFTTKATIRNVIENCLNNTKDISPTGLAQAIDTVSYISTGQQGQKDFAQIKRLISGLTSLQSSIANSAIGNETVTNNLTNFKIQSTVLRGSQNVSINMGNIQFPNSIAFLNNTDNYVKLSVVEWKLPIYSWIKGYSNLKSGTVTIDVEGISGKIVNITEPINITFPMNVSQISSKNLTQTKCLYYDNKSGQFIISGMKLLKIDLNQSIGSCQTSHLSDFAMGIPTPSPYSGPIPRYIQPVITEITRNIYEIHRSPLFWFTISITLILGYLCCWAYCKERSEEELAKLMRLSQYAEQKDFFQDHTENMPQKNETKVENFVGQEAAGLDKKLETIQPIGVPSSSNEPNISLDNSKAEFTDKIQENIKESGEIKDLKEIEKEENKKSEYDPAAVPEPGAEKAFKRKKRGRKKKIANPDPIVSSPPPPEATPIPERPPSPDQSKGSVLNQNYNSSMTMFLVNFCY